MKIKAVSTKTQTIYLAVAGAAAEAPSEASLAGALPGSARPRNMYTTIITTMYHYKKRTYHQEEREKLSKKLYDKIQ